MSEIFFAKNLKFLRKSKKLTIIDLASIAPKGKSMLNDYENGKSEPNLEMLIWISDYFGIKIDDVICKDLSITEYEPKVVEKINVQNDLTTQLLLENRELHIENKELGKENTELKEQLAKCVESQGKSEVGYLATGTGR